MQGLEGVKVLELGYMVSAAYATKLMADLGADVIKVEEPGGDRARQRGPFPGGIVDPEKSGLFLYLNTNKRGVTLDPRRERGKLLDLIAWADILVHNYPPGRMAELGIDYEAFRAVNPRLVMCSITPFGLTGPHKEYKAYGSPWRTAADRKANEDELERLLTAWTEPCGKWEVTLTLPAAGVAAFPSMNSKDLAEDPHLEARGFFVRLPHPEVGVRTHTGIPWRLAHAPHGVRAPAPLLGQDTDWVMRELLGYSAEEMNRLKEQKVLY